MVRTTTSEVRGNGGGGPAPEIGSVLRARAQEVCERVVVRWRESADPTEQPVTVVTDIRRSSLAATMAVADYLVTGEAVTRDRSEEWDWTGEAPLMGRITLSGLTKIYLHWRRVVEDTLREEIRRVSAEAELLAACLEVLHTGFDVSLVRMAKRFEATRRSLEEQVSEQQARLEHQALHDPLTGLANRVLLLDRIDHALESASRRPSRPALLFMDLDYFKAVNDVSGHSAGDQLLLQVARRLHAVVRPSDTIARLGGDEFVVLCEDLADPVAEGIAVAERITARFDDPFTVGSREILVAASIGVAPAGERDSAEALLGRADHAMYRAKQLGRGRVELYDPSIDLQEMRRAEMAAALHHARSEQQLELLYQPLVDLRARRTLAREALVRWRHPVFGSVAPSEMIPLAESTGLISDIGSWVLTEASRACAAWREGGEPDVGVAVNVSGVQLTSGIFHSEVEEALKESGIPPAALTAEVTETLLMTDRAEAREALERVRALGVRIAIDDFGTGCSSLSWLARLPVDVVKVDRSFVATLGARDRQSAIVEAMIKLAHTLDLSVVAEGVETDEQLEQLALLGCDAAQGFLLGRPVALGDLPALA